MELATPLPPDDGSQATATKDHVSNPLERAERLQRDFQQTKMSLRPNSPTGSLQLMDPSMQKRQPHMRRRSGILSGSRDETIAPSLAEKLSVQAARRQRVATESAIAAGRDLELRQAQETQSWLERDTPLPQTAYLRYRVAEDNRQLAELGRAEREALGALKGEQSAAWMAQGRERVQEGLERQKRSRKLRKELMRRRGRTVRQLRDEEKSSEQLLLERDTKYYHEMRKRVLEASALDSKLDTSEEREQAATRRAGTKRKEELTKEVAAVRHHDLERRRDMAKEIRGLTERASAEHVSLVALARQRGEVKREAAKQRNVERLKRDLTYIERAKANRERAMATRERARVALAEALETRKKGATKERGNDYMVAEEKSRILCANRKEVAQIYKSRFASRGAAAEYTSQGSYWRGLAASAAWFATGGALVPHTVATASPPETAVEDAVPEARSRRTTREATSARPSHETASSDRARSRRSTREEASSGDVKTAADAAVEL